MKQAAQLLKQLGKAGDDLLRPGISSVNEDLQLYPLDKTEDRTWITPWLLQSFLPNYPWSIGFVYLALVPIAILELVLLILRPVFYPFFYAAWKCELMMARWMRRSFDCPLCNIPAEHPFFYCPACEEIQPILRPTLECFFFRTCSCGKTVWFIWGQHFRRHAKLLICRNTDRFFGCYRPHPWPRLAGRRLKRCVLAGTSVRSKHMVLASLMTHWCEPTIRNRGVLTPAHQVGELELELCRKCLLLAYEEETDKAEKPGQKYTLARSVLLRSVKGNRGFLLNSVPQTAFVNSSDLAGIELVWHTVDCLILVIDDFKPGEMPPAEYYARLVRVIEEDLELPIGQTLPIKLAVVMPVPADEDDELTETEVQERLLELDSALTSMIRCTLAAKAVRYFGGRVPAQADPSPPPWVTALALWVQG